MNNREIENKRKRKFWQAHIEKFQESGLPQVEYCRQNNLVLHRFGYWKAKLTKREPPACFVSVPLQDSPMKALVGSHRSDALRLIVGERYRIEIGEGFCASALKTLLQVLEGI